MLRYETTLKFVSLLLAAHLFLLAPGLSAAQEPQVQEFNFYNTDVHLVLKALAEVTGVTFVEDVPISGKVTIHVAKKTPLDEVVDTMLQPLGLTWRKVGSTYHVGLKSEEKAAPGRPGYVQKSYMLKHAAAGEAARRLRKLLRARGVVSVDLPMNSLTVTVPPSLVPEVENVIKKTDVEEVRKLISIRIKVLEVVRDENAASSASISYNDYAASMGVGSIFNDPLNNRRGWGEGSSGYRSVSGVTTWQAIDEWTSYYRNAATFKVGAWGIDEIVARIKVAAGDTNVKTVSEPDVAVIEGQEATVNIGEKLPIDLGDGFLRYEDAGISLTVKPQVAQDGYVTMEILATASQRTKETSSGFNFLATREVKTSLSLLNGDTGRLGGLLSQQETISEEKIPFLGDLPLLGFFFRNHSSRTLRKELVILLSPSIVEDVPPHCRRSGGISAVMAWLQPGTTNVVVDWSDDVPQDNIGVFRYKIYRDTRPIVSLARLAPVADSVPRAATSWLDVSRKIRGATYYYAVTGVDGAGNEQAVSNSPGITIPKR